MSAQEPTQFAASEQAPQHPQMHENPAPAPQQPGYPAGSPQWYPTPYPQGAPRWNILAIVTIIAAFVMPLAGIITGHISLKELRTSGEQGAGLAKAGLIISYVFTALIVLMVIAYFVFFVVLFAVGSTGGYMGDWS